MYTKLPSVTNTSAHWIILARLFLLFEFLIINEIKAKFHVLIHQPNFHFIKHLMQNNNIFVDGKSKYILSRLYIVIVIIPQSFNVLRLI